MLFHQIADLGFDHIDAMQIRFGFIARNNFDDRIDAAVLGGNNGDAQKGHLARLQLHLQFGMTVGDGELMGARRHVPVTCSAGQGIAERLAVNQDHPWMHKLGHNECPIDKDPAFAGGQFRQVRLDSVVGHPNGAARKNDAQKQDADGFDCAAHIPLHCLATSVVGLGDIRQYNFLYLVRRFRGGSTRYWFSRRRGEGSFPDALYSQFVVLFGRVAVLGFLSRCRPSARL